MIKLKQKLFLFSFLILFFTINNNKVIAMYSNNFGTSNPSLTKEQENIDEKILKFQDILEAHKKIIIAINKVIQKLPDENLKKDMLYELQDSYLQLIDFFINHNPIIITKINNSETINPMLTKQKNLTMHQIILKIKYFIETNKYQMIILEQEMQKLSDNDNKNYILCELYNLLIKVMDDNTKDLRIQDIVLELMS
ncbi:hypothetical protein H7686_0001125 [Candidatus Phytoplasma asiaticum]|uniref:Sequence-variable mosaic (SVM) signal sequence domain-containing protein n=1 Tax=Candidatus Phytoplasma asiaticum TaxID=2763338 RepID=A0AAX3B9Y5_9MOLU|nr:hypothetical protein ['Parthenium hysterophorus' phyllody phytoplasma]UQV27405.1 hypothetical protein H7686_0001125 ['Parthenium hysterophorus' phyllody phytoplasma]